MPLYNIRAAAAGARQAADRQSETAPPNSHEDLMQALTAGNSSISAAQVRKARGRLTPEEIETVLAHAADMEDSGRAAMIMAELSAGLLGHRAIADRLFQLLEHDALGSTAALLLAKSADPDIIVRLAETAESGRGLSSRRAESALAAVSPGEER